MADRRRPAGRGLAHRAVVVALTTLALCVGGGAAWAFWADGGLAAGPGGPITAGVLPAADTTCTDTDGQLFETAQVTWPEVSASRAVDYTATINDEPVAVTDNGTTRAVVIDQTVLEQLFGGLSDGTLTVEVTGSLPGTAWTTPVATETVQAGVVVLPPGLTLECTS